jgi:hypothetical protein
LCCMSAKLEMLCECRRVARPGARMEFSVIDLAPGLSDAERELAIDGGPPYVEAPDDYAVLLARSDWRIIERIDMTAEYARLARILVEATIARSNALLAALGPEEFGERLSHRQATLKANERGLLRREIFLVGAGC